MSSLQEKQACRISDQVNLAARYNKHSDRFVAPKIKGKIRLLDFQARKRDIRVAKKLGNV